MKAVVWHGVGEISVDEVPDPKIQDPTDAVVEITASAVCGTDLHFVRGTMSGMVPGTILGHEAVGIVREVGPGVRNLRPGDRVVVPSTIGGPAAEQAEQQAGQFERERSQVAPEQNPQGDRWVPGDAPSQSLQWAVQAVAKAGTIGVIGVYPPQLTAFPTGAAMNKNLTVKMGNCNHRRYLPRLLDLVRTGAVDPSTILTQVEDLPSVLDAYGAFDERHSGWTKVAVDPGVR